MNVRSVIQLEKIYILPSRSVYNPQHNPNNQNLYKTPFNFITKIYKILGMPRYH